MVSIRQSRQQSQITMSPTVTVHIPHASPSIPAEERPRLAISNSDLRLELLRMTDWYTDELFDLGPEASYVRFPVSRLIVDPERFADDDAEPMAARGMGAIYERTSDGRVLRPVLDAEERERLLAAYYVPHHKALETAVQHALAQTGRALIIDAHSFPSSPLPCDLDQNPDRPDICIGTDSFHTPEWLRTGAMEAFRDAGWSVEQDRPYAGSIVPQCFHQRDGRVHSVMVEINRALCMDERTGDRLPRLGGVALEVSGVLNTLVTASH